MITKFDIEIDNATVIATCQRLTNQIWKLIPMRENEEDWQKQLETCLNEVVGLADVFGTYPKFLETIIKLDGMLIRDSDFAFFRKTVFETIGLVQELKKSL